jgi:hypothetical protein
VGHRLLRDGELLLLQRAAAAAANGDAPGAKCRETLVGGLRASRSTTRHRMPTLYSKTRGKRRGERDSRLSCTARAPFRRRRHAQFKFCVRHAHVQLQWAPPNFKLFKRRRHSSLHPTSNGNSIPTNTFYYESLPASRSMNDASSHPVYERVYSWFILERSRSRRAEHARRVLVHFQLYSLS